MSKMLKILGQQWSKLSIPFSKNLQHFGSCTHYLHPVKKFIYGNIIICNNIINSSQMMMLIMMVIKCLL